jgi:hypothetical protein
MPSIETAVMVAIGGLILLFGWSQWSSNLQPGVEEQVKQVKAVIGSGGGAGSKAPAPKS